jgi:hypothetical protein
MLRALELGAVAAGLAACSAGTSTGSAAATTSAAAAALAEIPDETPGPYPATGPTGRTC